MKEKYYVYILLIIKDKRYYVGYTTDLKRRLTEHASGKSLSTRNRRPLKLIFYEYFTNKKDAKAREVYLKSGYGHKQLESILKNTFNRV